MRTVQSDYSASRERTLENGNFSSPPAPDLSPKYFLFVRQTVLSVINHSFLDFFSFDLQADGICQT